MVDYASMQASALIEKLCAGNLSLVKSQPKSRTARKAMAITLSKRRVESFLNVKVPDTRIRHILTGLGFKTGKAAAGSFKVSLPSFRPDVRMEEDLFEEIARIFGYDCIPNTLPKVAPQAASRCTQESVIAIKAVLAGLGLQEAITYSLIDRDWLKGFDFNSAGELLEVQNPLSQEQEILRPTLLPSLVNCVAYNLNQKQELVNIFEIAKSYRGEGKLAKEELMLGIAICGSRSFLSSQGKISEEMGFGHLKGMVQALLERLGINDYRIAPKKRLLYLVSTCITNRQGSCCSYPKKRCVILTSKTRRYSC